MDSQQHPSEEVRLLQQLLSDAHHRIRELQAQVQQLSAALLMVTLSDRRRATGFHAPDSSERERRRESNAAVSPVRERRGPGRRNTALNRPD